MKKLRMAKCESCIHCHTHYKSTRKEVVCNHPNQEVISKYFKEHKMNRAEGLIAYIPIGSIVKQTPKWCPKDLAKKEVENSEEL